MAINRINLELLYIITGIGVYERMFFNGFILNWTLTDNKLKSFCERVQEVKPSNKVQNVS